MPYVYLLAALPIVVVVAGTLSVLRARRSRRTFAAMIASVVGANIITALVSGAFVLLAPAAAWAQEPATSQGISGAALGAALSTGLACIGAGIAVGIAGAAAIGGITEKPQILGRTLIFVGLAEGIAIYGLIISFMILNA